jgi:hypothetical protein
MKNYFVPISLQIATGLVVKAKSESEAAEIAKEAMGERKLIPTMFGPAKLLTDVDMDRIRTIVEKRPEKRK